MSVASDFSVNVLHRVWKLRHRLQTALKNRAHVRQLIMDKQPVTDHYRYRFVVDSALLIGDFIQDLANEFDRDHPDDQCLNLDVDDMLKLIAARFNLNKKP